MHRRDVIKPAEAILLTVAAHLATLSLAQAQQEDDIHLIDKSAWPCAYCPAPETGPGGDIELSFGSLDAALPISQDPIRQTDEGFAWWIGGQYRNLLPNGLSLDAQGQRLGLDNPVMQLDVDHPGRFDLMLAYQRIHSSARRPGQTPFRHVGQGQLELPDNWLSAGRTADMAQLQSGSQAFTPGQTFDRIHLGTRLQAVRHWDFEVKLSQNKRRGSIWSPGSFLTQSSFLPAPLDEHTDQLEVSIGHQQAHWNIELSYLGSQFRNDIRALRWQNPFNPLRTGAEFGQKALAPDNQAHQFSLAAGYRHGRTLSMSGALSAGQQQQDASLLPLTINPHLAVDAPGQRDAEARLQQAMFRLLYRPTGTLRLKFQYREHERDNRSHRTPLNIVQSDLYIDDPRTPFDDGRRRQSLKLEADVRLQGSSKLRLGWEEQRKQRSSGYREETDEQKTWLRLKLQPQRWANLSLQLTERRRGGSSFRLNPDELPPQNPLMRAVNLSDRKQTDTQLRLHLEPLPWLQLALQAAYQDQRTASARLGPGQSERLSLNADLSIAFAEFWQLSAFAASHRDRLDQTGAETEATPHWEANSDDRQRNFGFSLSRTQLWKRFDLSLDYQHLQGRSDLQTRQFGLARHFPDLLQRWHHLSLRGVYHWRPRLDLSLNYRWERYVEDDWQQDDLASESIANLLGPGSAGWNARSQLLMASLRYRY